MMSDTVGQRIGIFGGSFDPIHMGHLLVAEQCREQLHLDHVLFIPAARSPFKLDQQTADAKHRWEMLQLAIGGNPYFLADERELKRGGTSFTIDTLKELHAELPNRHFLLLIGADALSDFAKWREPAEICRLAQVVVVGRGGHAAPNLSVLQNYLAPSEQPGSVQHYVPIPECEISASRIRQTVAAGRSIRYQVPSAVAAYIEQHQLYRSVAPSPST